MLRVAHRLADAAGRAILPFFRADFSVENKEKGGFDPVTEADRAAETAMRDVLAELRPDDGILGEEFGTSAGSSGWQWVLDPIDGTRAFLCGAPSWGVLIGAGQGDAPEIGIVDQPFTGERWSGGPEGALFHHREATRAISVRKGRGLREAVVLTTFPEVGSDAEGAAFRRVAERAQLTRYGLDCYAYMLLAMGQVDLVIEAGLKPYDIQGPMAVVAAAGGIVTNWQGGPAHQGGQVIAAGDPDLHAAALDLLAG
ncbi:histidinol-phosphatase [Paracoccaceae bacterium GXU_MW_L88]